MATAASGSIFSKANALACSGVDFVTRGKALSGCPGSVTSEGHGGQILSSVVTLAPDRRQGFSWWRPSPWLARRFGLLQSPAPQGPHPRTARVPDAGAGAIPGTRPAGRGTHARARAVRSRRRPGARGAGSSSNERPVRPARSCRPPLPVGVDGCGVEIGPDDDTVQACLGIFSRLRDPCRSSSVTQCFSTLCRWACLPRDCRVRSRFSGPGLCLRAAAAIFARVASVARSRSSRLRARCWRSRGLKQTRRRSPGNSGLRISATVSGPVPQDYPWGPSAVCGGRPCAGPRSSPGRPVTDRCGCVPR